MSDAGYRALDNCSKMTYLEFLTGSTRKKIINNILEVRISVLLVFSFVNVPLGPSMEPAQLRMT